MSVPSQDVEHFQLLTPYALSPVPDQITEPKPEALPETIDPPLPIVPNGVLNIPTDYVNALSDNETAEFIWNYPPPHSIPFPVNQKSSYRRIGCTSDGSSCFHAIAKAISPIYMYSYKVPNEISEKTLRQFEITVHEQIRFPDSIFDKHRTGNGNYRIEKISDYRYLMDQFRRTFVRLFRKDFADLVGKDSKIRRSIDGRGYETEVLTDFCEVIHLRQYVRSSGLDINYKKELLQLREQVPQWPSIRARITDAQREEVRNALGSDKISTLTSSLAKQDMITSLISGDDISPIYLTYLANHLNIDIYVLQDKHLTKGDLNMGPLYLGAVFHKHIKGAPRNVIVLSMLDDSRYELIGRVDIQADESRNFTVTFNQDEPLAAKLAQILEELRSGSGF